MGTTGPLSVKTGFRYIRLADDMENKIREGIYRAGEKLPSIRKLHDQTGFSITTVYQAYVELEIRGMVEARQRSGYYVKPMLRQILPSPSIKKHHATPQKVSINTLAYSIVEAMSDPEMLQLGGTIVVPELLPYKQLFRTIKTMPNHKLRDILTTYEKPDGSRHLKRQIAKRTLGHTRDIDLEEILITGGCIEAVSLCLQAVAEPGDTIIVESPTYPWFLQIIEDLNMYALEIPTDPATGIELDSMEMALDHHRVKACILIPNAHNPLGCIMPTEKKKAVLDLAGNRDIPIIEDDIHGDLCFEKTRPLPLKAYDRKGQVLYCSSFSKTLSPGLRVGWTMPGRFKDMVRRLKLNASIASPSLNQYIVSEYLKGGYYDRHLRRLRTALKSQVSNMALAVARHFPADTKMTAPEGGLAIWVQLGDHMDGLKIFHEARKQRIAIMPGVLCSTTDKYKNYIRLSCGFPWSERLETGVRTLGEIIRGQALG